MISTTIIYQRMKKLIVSLDKKNLHNILFTEQKGLTALWV